MIHNQSTMTEGVGLNYIDEIHVNEMSLYKYNVFQNSTNLPLIFSPILKHIYKILRFAKISLFS